MSRDLFGNNYYITTGGKVPVKWTAPEVIENHEISILCTQFNNFRHFTSGSIQFSVMCGVMDVYYMRYGVWDTNHMKVKVAQR